MGLDLQSFYEFAATVEEIHQVEDDEDSERTVPALENVAADPALSPDALCAQVEAGELLRNAMGMLKAEHRRALRMYYFEEQTMSQIALAMHVTESRISQIHARAIEELALQLRQVKSAVQ